MSQSVLSAVCALYLAAQIAAAAVNPATPGDFRVEPPTLLSLGFEWRIAGDENANARVAASYRLKGEKNWRPAQPLLRLHGERTHEGVFNATEQLADVNHVSAAAFNYTAPNMFAGSILNLEPGAEYECRFVMTDPDGVRGKSEKIVTVRTRKEPGAVEGGRTFHVYPVDWKGPKQQPAFTGLMEAYYMAGRAGDHQNAYPPRVQPGDVIVMHAGTYKSDRHHYFNQGPHEGYLAMGTLFDGTYYLTQPATADKPIVIKGAGDGEVIFDGDGAQTLFNVMAAHYNYFENISIRNTNLAFMAGIKNITGVNGFVLKHSKLTDVGRGVQDDWSGSKNFYIADNTLIGRHDPDRMMGWNGAFWQKLPGYPETMDSEYAIKLYGQGHVVAYNYIANWHDGVDIATYGDPDGVTPDGKGQEDPDRAPVAIDFYNNDISNMGDNCIESDGGAHNIRVFRNRCFNSASYGFSSQPVLGGPAYFYENLEYNTPTGRSTGFIATSAGILCYNNTFVGGSLGGGPVSNFHFRNNLVIGADTPGPILTVQTYTNYSDSDYNGYRPNRKSANQVEWASPPEGTLADFMHAPAMRRFKTIKEFADATHNEQHSVQVDYDVFTNVQPPDNSQPQKLYKGVNFDFTLKPGSAAIGAGTPLANVIAGQGNPSLGALQPGAPVPHYGPH